LDSAVAVHNRFFLPMQTATAILTSMVKSPASAPRLGRQRPRKLSKATTFSTVGADSEVAGSCEESIASALLEDIEGIIARSEPALARLYDATVSRVYGVALRIARTPEAAEEIVSDVYMQVWRDASRFDATRGSVIAWLLIITRSRALDWLRRKDEAFSHPDPHELVAEDRFAIGGPFDLLAQSRSNTALSDAIKQLPPLQRQLLAIAFFRGLSHSEIQEHTGLALGTIKTCIRSTLTKLRELLGDEAVGHF
jgi:RNA polymerase sigma factor (sigma-70 family)